MNIVQKNNLLQVALRGRYTARQAEITKDYVVAVRCCGHYATTDAITHILVERVQFGPHIWHQEYERVRRTLDHLMPYIFNKGTAGSSGNYWGLTAEGEQLLKSCFEYQLVKAIGSEKNG